MKNIHGIVNVPAHLRPMPAAPITDQPVRSSVIQFAPRIDHQCDIQIAPQIFVPDIAAGGSNMVSSNETCIIIEDEDTDYITIDNGKRVSIANTVSAARAKKARIEMVRSRGLREISTSANRKIVWYYAKNMDKVQNYNIFLNALKSDLTNVLETHVKKNAIKFNLKLEATYNRPNVENSSENRAFKTSAVELFRKSDILALVEESFTKLLTEEEAYTSRGSGFTLESIDGLLLGVYKYTPMSGSSYISLPDSIDRKKGTINPQNNDQQCFKWSILAKHVTEQTKCRIGENYRKHEGKYIFDGISFPTPLSDIKIFEKNNPFVSINIFGIEKRIQPPKKFPTYKIFPLRVVEDEKRDHFDLLLMTENDNTHYIYISNFSRLIRSQKTRHTGSFIFCKRCFTSFDHRPRKYQLSGQAALEHHRLICGPHKPILPKMPAEGAVLEFNAWQNAQRHPIVIYADFEALLVKTEEEKGGNTTIIQKHKPMSYGFLVKASEDVSNNLLIEHGIPSGPVIYRGDESNTDVARHFVESIVEVAHKIENLMKTNIPITMTEVEEKTHQECTECNLCKRILAGGDKARDHNHLTGKFRQTLCSRCNLELQQPKFVPVFFHNLSNYDSHFIITELGYDTKTINVIPNSEEKFISFSKYISSTFTVRFIDTFRSMASSLSSLAENLITPGLENFRETAKHFTAGDMPLVTRKGVYPYEYTDSWERLEDITLPSKRSFYSTLTETGIRESEFDHAKEVWSHFNCRTLGDYSDLYLKIDVLLLADVFENFRNECMKAYNLDPAHYFTAPGLSFDAMLKYTGQKLQLLDDYDMLLMFENGIRGGLVQASKRYAKANNMKTPGYDDTKEKSWIIYQDCNNLYGWAMSQYMPYGGFNWVEPTLNGLYDLDNTSPIGVRTGDVNEKNLLINETNDSENYSLISDKICDPCDPANALPKYQLEKKERIMKAPFCPILEVYPRSKFGNTLRSFNKSWYLSFDWLEYSPKLDRAFCFPCRMFVTSSGLNAGYTDLAFTQVGFKNWNNATSKFKMHQNTKNHSHNVKAHSDFLNGKSINIVLDDCKTLLISQKEKQRQNNRSIMRRLIDVTLCLAKSGKPFRGHHENMSSVSKGLFLDFIDVLKKYDNVLENHLEKGALNAKYLSNRIQNDLLTCINNVMKRTIQSKIKNRTVSIMADETSDVGHHEQMSVIIRYFDEEKCQPIEYFIGLQRLLSVTSEAIFNSLSIQISNLNIEWKSVIAVCFDGASAMSGKFNGVQAKVKELNPNISYVHCYGHCLNLVLVDCLGSKNRVIFDFFGCVQLIYSFIEGSPSRHAVLERIVQETNIKLKTLKSLSTTRWACRSESVSAIENNYNSLLQCLKEISETTTQPDVRVQANGIIYQMKSYNFIFALYVMKPLLAQIQIVSAKLQTSNLNLLSAVTIVQALKKSLISLRSDEDEYSRLYNKVLDVCNAYQIEIPNVKHRRVSNKIDNNHTQHFSLDKKSEMKTTVYYVVLDDLFNGLENRFSQETLNLINSISCMMQHKIESLDIDILTKKFDLHRDEFEGELRLIRAIPDFEGGTSNNTIHKWLEKLSTLGNFINVQKTLKLFTTIPVTTCSCERAFSKLSLVKTKLRSQMKQNRLDSLMMIFVEQELASQINPDDIIDEFKSMYPATRRLEL
ncbi:hypothetical protein QTP88_025883 [Uroleucon formosanum]